jgi:broad specificity phosphatase PhoE
MRRLAGAIGLAMLWSPQQDATLRLYSARHSQTNWNVDRRLQATALAERLKGIHLDAVYSTTLMRSRDTEDIVHGAAPLRPLSGLNNRRLGAECLDRLLI